MAFRISISRFLSLMALCLCAAMALPLIALANRDKGGPVRYYVSLGTSLAVGVQPDAAGDNQLTDEGYPDQLFTGLQQDNPKLKLIKLGCPGETAISMIEGGKCTYPHGSQLNAAARFLHAHKDKVDLVTIDIGVNDILVGGCIEGIAIDIPCLLAVFESIATNLNQILSVLDEVAGPNVSIVGMNYYNTFLAAWLLGPDGQDFARGSADLAAALNAFILGGTYASFGIPVADVAGIFQSSDFETMVIFPLPPDFMVPINVASICQLTYMCVPAPVGPNIHATKAGYAAIAAAFLAVLPE